MDTSVSSGAGVAMMIHVTERPDIATVVVPMVSGDPDVNSVSLLASKLRSLSHTCSNKIHMDINECNYMYTRIYVTAMRTT